MTATTAAAGTDEQRLARRNRVLAFVVLLAIVLLASSLRLRAAVETEIWPQLQGDSIDYVSAAYNLHHFGVFSSTDTWSTNAAKAPAPDAVRDPAYPALLSLLLSDRPDPAFLRRVLLVQALLGIATVGLAWLLAAQLLAKPAALAVTALVAVNPQLISLGTSTLTETLFAALVAAFLCAIVRALLRGGAAWYGLAGVLLGFSVLTRPTLEYLPLLLLPALAWAVPRSRWKPCLALLLGFALTFGPWIARNERAIGSASDPTLMTNTLLHGSYQDFMYQGKPQSLGYPYRFDPASSRIHTPAQSLARIREDFAADPGGMLRWYLLSKPVRFFDWDFVEGSGSIFLNTVRRSPYLEGQRDFLVSYEAMYFLHWPLVALGYVGLAIALFGAFRSGRNATQEAMGMLGVTMLFVIALHMIGFPLGRYSMPFRPLTYLLAIYALVTATGWLRTRR